jgi:hypothetical protein
MGALQYLVVNSLIHAGSPMSDINALIGQNLERMQVLSQEADMPLIK